MNIHFSNLPDSTKIKQNWPLQNSNCCISKSTHWKELIFGCLKLEVYRVDWPRVEWVGPTHMGHTPTLKIGILQCKTGQPVWLLSTTVHFTYHFKSTSLNVETNIGSHGYITLSHKNMLRKLIFRETQCFLMEDFLIIWHMYLGTILVSLLLAV